MAVNETTGIDYAVDRFAIWKVSTGSYINLNAVWPRVDGGPLVGANPDLLYYKKVNLPAPDADHRFTVTSTWGKVEASPTPAEGHPSGTYEPVYTLEKLSVTELKKQVETAFQAELQKIFPQTATPSVLIEVADAIVRKQNGAVLTEKQESDIAQFTGIGDVVTQLRNRQAELNAAIDADEDYDITLWPIAS
jgi:hypothetical protein